MTKKSVEDPIARFKSWLDQAGRRGIVHPEATALATADANGHVSVRVVLMKQVDDRGFVFYTDRRSRKGRELKQNPCASLAFHWRPLRKQVCVRGRVEELASEEVDRYWETRPRESRLAGSVSRQSAVLTSRSELMAAVEALRRRLRGRPIPRPPYWTGFRVLPEEIEFWTHRAHRLHQRELFIRNAGGEWRKLLLQP